MPVELRVYDGDFGTLIGVLDQPYGVGWARERLDTGVGELTIPHDSPVLAANPGILTRGHVVVVAVDGIDEFVWLVRRRHRTRGSVWDAVTVAGPGALELLRKGLVYNRGGECTPEPDERVFGWQTFDYDDVGGINGGGWGEVGTSMTGGPLTTEGWPDPDAVAFEPIFPGERALYRRRMLAVPGAAGPARMVLVATHDTSVVVYLDGIEVLAKEEGARGLHVADVPYCEYDQQLAVEVTGGSGRWGWTWIRLNVPLDEGDPTTYGSVLRRTYDPAAFPGADTPWLSYEGALPYPGVTPGFLLGRLFDEAKARGAFSPLVRDFTDSHDSAGQPWPFEIEFVCQTGDDNLLTVCERLRDHHIDAAVTPAGVFQAWHDRGVDRGVTPEPYEASVTFALNDVHDLEMDAEDDVANVVLSRTRRSWFERPTPPLTGDRHEVFVAQGLAPTDEGAARVADDVLDTYDKSVAVVRFTVSSSQAATPRPTVDYDLGDVVAGPWIDPAVLVTAQWAVEDVKIDTIAATVTEVGDVDWVVEASAP